MEVLANMAGQNGVQQLCPQSHDALGHCRVFKAPTWNSGIVKLQLLHSSLISLQLSVPSPTPTLPSLLHAAKLPKSTCTKTQKDRTPPHPYKG